MIKGFIAFGDMRPTVAGFDQLATVGGEGLLQSGVLQETKDAFDHRGFIADERVVSIVDGDAIDTEGGSDDRAAHCQRFQHLVFDARSQMQGTDEDTGTSKIWADVRDTPGDTD